MLVQRWVDEERWERRIINPKCKTHHLRTFQQTEKEKEKKRKEKEKASQKPKRNERERRWYLAGWWSSL